MTVQRFGFGSAELILISRFPFGILFGLSVTLAP
jgi:hypothetical protein